MDSFPNAMPKDLLRRTLFKYDVNATNCVPAQPHESENRLKVEPEPNNGAYACPILAFT